MQVTFKGTPVQTSGQLPKVGTKAPDFKLIKTDLQEVHLKDFANKTIIMNIFLSIDTSVCAESVKHFNKLISNMENVVALCISLDLPFTQERYCAAQGLNNVMPLSAFRSPEFGKDYGVALTSGPLVHLLSRAVVVIDPTGKVIYTEQVPELTHEPNYEAVLKSIKK